LGDKLHTRGGVPFPFLKGKSKLAILDLY